MAGFPVGPSERTMTPMFEPATLLTILGPAAAPLAGLGPILATWFGMILVKGSPGGRP